MNIGEIGTVDNLFQFGLSEPPKDLFNDLFAENPQPISSSNAPDNLFQFDFSELPEDFFDDLFTEAPLPVSFELAPAPSNTIVPGDVEELGGFCPTHWAEQDRILQQKFTSYVAMVASYDHIHCRLYPDKIADKGLIEEYIRHIIPALKYVHTKNLNSLPTVFAALENAAPKEVRDAIRSCTPLAPSELLKKKNFIISLRDYLLPVVHSLKLGLKVIYLFDTLIRCTDQSPIQKLKEKILAIFYLSLPATSAEKEALKNIGKRIVTALANEDFVDAKRIEALVTALLTEQEKELFCRLEAPSISEEMRIKIQGKINCEKGQIRQLKDTIDKNHSHLRFCFTFLNQTKK